MKNLLVSIGMAMLFTGCAKHKLTENFSTVTETVVVTAPSPKFTCKAFDLSSQSVVSNLPDLSVVTPSASFVASDINNPQVNETTPLRMTVGTEAEVLLTKFALECSAKLKVTESGVHTLSLRSDDGSILFLNGISVVNHLGLHTYTRRTANVNLDKGTYDITLRYFQNLGQKGLILSWVRPNVGFEEVIDSSNLSQ